MTDNMDAEMKTNRLRSQRSTHNTAIVHKA